MVKRTLYVPFSGCLLSFNLLSSRSVALPWFLSEPEREQNMNEKIYNSDVLFFTNEIHIFNLQYLDEKPVAVGPICFRRDSNEFWSCNALIVFAFKFLLPVVTKSRFMLATACRAFFFKSLYLD